MPTSVSSARQCLAAEAATALDAAVATARRRCHAQTTSLHVVFALLSSTAATSSPILRDALSRARSSAYSPRLQYKALELCFSVALDRLPSSSAGGGSGGGDEPPVSNSLMAAIKRSQANQRRNPDTFHLYQQQCAIASTSVATGFSGVKVELQPLVLAILDDPIVSRVFGEAGFRSTEIKLAILRPPPPILRFPRAGATRCPPLFLCNFASATAADELVPVAGAGENCRRIGEILSRRAAGAPSPNPMLVGVGASEAAADFCRAVESNDWTVLPPELRGIVLTALNPDASDGIEDAVRRASGCDQPGIVLSIGDLSSLVDEAKESGGDDKSAKLVAEVTKVLELFRGRVWVMGWSSTYETYLKFLSKFPLLDKDWELQLLPITTVRGSGAAGTSSCVSAAAAAAAAVKPPSLMDSFVPFGGFFSGTYAPSGFIGGPCIPTIRCQQCHDKCEQEVATIMKAGTVMFDGQEHRGLASWSGDPDLLSSNEAFDIMKANDDNLLLNSKIINLQKKWNDYCFRMHRGCSRIPMEAAELPRFISRPYASSDGEATENPAELMKTTSDARREGLISKLKMNLEKAEKVQPQGFDSARSASSNLLGMEDHASPASVIPVATDLVLGTPLEASSKTASLVIPRGEAESREKFRTSRMKNGTQLPCERLNLNVSAGLSSFNHTPLAASEKFDVGNYKSICSRLFERVGRQEEALSKISQCVVQARTSAGRRGQSFNGDIWLGFHGPDRACKRKIASALAELVYGSADNLISIDLSRQHGIPYPRTIYDRQGLSEFDGSVRGMTVSDLIVAAIRKKPWSVIFLENVEKADHLVQNSLTHAIQTGKFPDSHGREFDINSVIFVLTTSGGTTRRRPDCPASCKFSEERVLAARPQKMNLFAEAAAVAPTGKVVLSLRTPENSDVSSKRKLRDYDFQERPDRISGDTKKPNVVPPPAALFDLNVPVDELEPNDAKRDDTPESNSLSDTSDAWADSFFDSLDETVTFDPYDFDHLADEILKEVSDVLRDILGSSCTMEVDDEAMLQILAATWAADDTSALLKWVKQVLGRSFTELLHSSRNTQLRLVLYNNDDDDDGSNTKPEEHAPGIFLPARVQMAARE